MSAFTVMSATYPDVRRRGRGHDIVFITRVIIVITSNPFTSLKAQSSTSFTSLIPSTTGQPSTMSAPAGPSNPSLVTGRIRDTDDTVNAQGDRSTQTEGEEQVVNKNKRFRKDKRQSARLFATFSLSLFCTEAVTISRLTTTTTTTTTDQLGTRTTSITGRSTRSLRRITPLVPFSRKAALQSSSPSTGNNTSENPGEPLRKFWGNMWASPSLPTDS
jgi:hypothetical protein